MNPPDSRTYAAIVALALMGTTALLGIRALTAIQAPIGVAPYKVRHPRSPWPVVELEERAPRLEEQPPEGLVVTVSSSQVALSHAYVREHARRYTASIYRGGGRPLEEDSDKIWSLFDTYKARWTYRNLFEELVADFPESPTVVATERDGDLTTAPEFERALRDAHHDVRRFRDQVGASGAVPLTFAIAPGVTYSDFVGLLAVASRAGFSRIFIALSSDGERRVLPLSGRPSRCQTFECAVVTLVSRRNGADILLRPQSDIPPCGGLDVLTGTGDEAKPTQGWRRSRLRGAADACPAFEGEQATHDAVSALRGFGNAPLCTDHRVTATSDIPMRRVLRAAAAIARFGRVAFEPPVDAMAHCDRPSWHPTGPPPRL